MNAKCAICAKPAVPEYRPFCSRRCADIDLGRWLKGVYVVPGDPSEDMASSDAIPAAPERDGAPDNGVDGVDSGADDGKSRDGQ